MKRILILTMVSLLMLNTVGFAAVGGSKMKMSAPKISNTQKANTNTSSDYKASAPANSYKEKAPEANAKSNANRNEFVFPYNYKLIDNNKLNKIIPNTAGPFN